MLLRSLRRRVVAWLQRPLGRTAAFALLMVLVSGGAPRWEFHAHAEAAAALAHVLEHAAAGSGDQQLPPDQQAPGDTTLHAHTVGTSVSSLPETPQLLLSQIPRALHDTVPVAAPALTSRRTPPHRPPIA